MMSMSIIFMVMMPMMIIIVDIDNSVWNINHGSNKTTKYVITKTDKNIAKAWMKQILQVVLLTRHLPKLK